MLKIHAIQGLIYRNINKCNFSLGDNVYYKDAYGIIYSVKTHETSSYLEKSEYKKTYSIYSPYFNRAFLDVHSNDLKGAVVGEWRVYRYDNCIRNQSVMTDKSIGKIYIAKSKLSPHIKIGYSNNPARRMEVLSIAQPGIELLECYPDNYNWRAAHMENLIHKALHDFHVGGEWFDSECVRFVRMVIALVKNM